MHKKRLTYTCRRKSCSDWDLGSRESPDCIHQSQSGFFFFSRGAKQLLYIIKTQCQGNALLQFIWRTWRAFHDSCRPLQPLCHILFAELTWLTCKGNSLYCFCSRVLRILDLFYYIRHTKWNRIILVYGPFLISLSRCLISSSRRYVLILIPVIFPNDCTITTNIVTLSRMECG